MSVGAGFLLPHCPTDTTPRRSNPEALRIYLHIGSIPFPMCASALRFLGLTRQYWEASRALGAVSPLFFSALVGILFDRRRIYI